MKVLLLQYFAYYLYYFFRFFSPVEDLQRRVRIFLVSFSKRFFLSFLVVPRIGQVLATGNRNYNYKTTNTCLLYKMSIPTILFTFLCYLSFVNARPLPKGTPCDSVSWVIRERHENLLFCFDFCQILTIFFLYCSIF